METHERVRLLEAVQLDLHIMINEYENLDETQQQILISAVNEIIGRYIN